MLPVQGLHLGQHVAQVLAVHTALAGAPERACRPAARGSLRPRRRSTASQPALTERRTVDPMPCARRPSRRIGLRTARACTATGDRARLAHGGATPRCRRRNASSSRPRGAGDSALPSSTSPRSPRVRRLERRAPARALDSARQSCGRSYRVAPRAWRRRSRRSAARPGCSCGTRARRENRRARPRRGPCPRACRRGESQQPRLPDQVERDVGQRDVLLEHRAVAAPLGQALAEDQRVRRGATCCRSVARRLPVTPLTCGSLRPAARRRSGDGRSCRPSARTVSALLVRVGGR